jgi:tetratricopeptide (TPR) repeat protein
MSFDYAYSGFGDLGNSHRFGLTVNFETPTIFATGTAAPDINKIYLRGVELFNQNRYPEAIIEFNKVLEIDSTNKDALEYMKMASEKMKKQ